MNYGVHFLATCLLLQAGVPASGQSLFDFGPKAGLNRDDLTTSYSHQPLLGGNIGLFARVKPPILPGVQGELLLSSVGSHVVVEDYETDVRMLAMQMPLFLVLSIGPVELHGGGYYERYLSKGVLDDASVEIEGETFDLTDVSDDGFGVLLGAGIHLSRLYAWARYNMGMTALGPAPYLDDVFSRQWQAYIALGVGGGGK